MRLIVEGRCGKASVMEKLTTDVAIIGAGPAGLFAVFECGMLKMSCVLIDALGETGGQCAALYPEKPIYDIPAHPGIEASELIARLEQQIAPFAPHKLLGQRVETCTGSQGDFTLTTSLGNTIHAKAVIVAAGAGAFGPTARRSKASRPMRPPAPCNITSNAARPCAASASSSPAAATRRLTGRWPSTASPNPSRHPPPRQIPRCPRERRPA